MHNYSFCTITTQSHLYKVYALADSLSMNNLPLNVLLVDADLIPIHAHSKIKFILLSELTSDLSINIINKYRGNLDKLRWALKSCFLLHLLNNYTKIIYIDNDVFFYNSPLFLFDKLTSSSILLTPHFYEANPSQRQNWLEANFRVGLFNAGFIGVNIYAMPFLEWWANCCLYNVKKSFWRGLFDDQKYLDLVPVLFNDVEILKHPGCNLSGWNYKNYHLSRLVNGDILIDDIYPIVFIHFAESSCIEFSSVNHCLYPEYKHYILLLKLYYADFSFKRSIFNKRTILTFLYFLKWKLFRLVE